MNNIREINKKSIHERFHMDSKGRRWTFTQKERMGRVLPANGHLNDGKLVWTCSECECTEPIMYESMIHDEVIVPDPTKQLDLHDCDVARVRQVHEM